MGTLVGISESQGRNHKRKDQKCRPRFGISPEPFLRGKKSIWMSILHSTGLNVGFSGLTNTFNYKGWCINNSNTYTLTFNKKMSAAKKNCFSN